MPTQKTSTVLIVDDDEYVVRLLRLVLESHGYLCLVAHSGAQALSLFTRHNPDLLITDLSMAWGDGLALMQEIRKNSSLPMLVVSGRTQEYALQLAALDNIFVLPKPIETLELLKHIRACCRRKKASPKAPQHA